MSYEPMDEYGVRSLKEMISILKKIDSKLEVIVSEKKKHKSMWKKILTFMKKFR